MSTLRVLLALGLAFALSYILVTIRRMRFPIGRGAKLNLPRIKQYTCDQCDTDPPHCCNIYEHCVSCCMHPLNVGAAPPGPGFKTELVDLFLFRIHRLYCYGLHRPLKVLPTVNSDSLHADWRAASREGAREYPISTTQLEPDPYYQKDE
uniref:Uncharacterized protein n=1 Tax=Hyaloperonospora arabidopsidis (strain Emoy2) TaxID=559515 RepID=M4BHW5_HYAAE